MRCPIETQETSEVLLAYCARKLDPGTAAALERHMASCPACRGSCESQSAVWNALDAWEPPPVPADFDRKLYSRIEEERRSPWWQRLFRPLGPALAHRALPVALAACLLVVAGAVMESSRQPDAFPQPEVKAEPVPPVDQVDCGIDDIELLHAFGQELRAQAANSM